MKIIRPVDIKSTIETSTDKIVSTNAPITETEWTAGTYTDGQRRYVGITLYEVSAASTTENPATTTTSDWTEVGLINPYKMFDARIASQTENTGGTIAVEIDPGELVNAVALFNVFANTVRIRVQDSVDGTVYDKTFIMQDNSAITNWYAYFFEPIVKKPDLAVLDLPNYANANILIDIDAGTDTAKCGELVLGRQQILGVTVLGTSVGIQDYSRKERDAFGNATILERAFSKRVDYDVRINTAFAGGVNKILTDIRTTPIVYVGDENKEETVVYGYFRDYSINLATHTISNANIEVEGLV